MNLVEVRIELELKVLIFLRDESVLLRLRLPRSRLLSVILLSVYTTIFQHFMKRVGIDSLDHGLSLMTTLVVQSLVFHFLGILLHENGLDLFLLLAEVFVLEHEHVDAVQIEIKGLVILDPLDLLLACAFSCLCF